MWACPKCAEKVEPDFDVCWSCGTSRAGVEDPDFGKEADMRREPALANPGSGAKRGGLAPPSMARAVPAARPGSSRTWKCWTRARLGRAPASGGLRRPARPGLQGPGVRQAAGLDLR